MPITLPELLLFLVLGGLAGWLAGLLIRGGGYGLVANVLIGILGAIIGGFVLAEFGLRFFGFWGQLLTALVGAILLVFVAGLLGKIAK